MPCPESCGGHGDCDEATGECDCDRFWTGENCSRSWGAYLGGFWVLHVTGVIVGFALLCVLSFRLLYKLHKKGGIRVHTTKAAAVANIFFATLVRVFGYAIDPYALRGVWSIVLWTIVFILFYVLCFMAYLLVLLVWVELAREKMQQKILLIPGHQKKWFYIIVSIILGGTVAFTIAFSITQGNTVVFVLFNAFVGVFVIGFSSCYVYYGLLLRRRLTAFRSTDMSANRRRFILKITSFMLEVGLISVACLIVLVIRSLASSSFFDPEPWLIYTSILRGVELSLIAVMLRLLWHVEQGEDVQRQPRSRMSLCWPNRLSRGIGGEQWQNKEVELEESSRGEESSREEEESTQGDHV